MKQEKWQAFVSLGWYDGLIEFLFRFVAKTSEPLLAAGLVISAADFLTSGALMRGNAQLSMGWAWTQAVAIEASSGVVFVYALHSFRQHDKVKAWLYLVLSILLAITGGAMLMFQLIVNMTGLQERALPGVVFYGLASLRVVVSVSYVYLCRAKYIRFTDLADTHEQPVHVPDVDKIVQAIIERVTVELAQAPALPEQAESKPANLEPIYQGKFTSKEQEVATILARQPGASVQEVAQEAGCNVRTAEKWMKRHKEKV